MADVISSMSVTELRRAAHQILKFGGKSLTTRDDYEISCALRELAATKEAITEWRSANEFHELARPAVDWIERRVTELLVTRVR